MSLGKPEEAWATLRVCAIFFFLNLTCSHAARGKDINITHKRYFVASDTEKTVNLLTEALKGRK